MQDATGIAAALVVGLSLGACATAPEDVRGVIVITLDTTRADRLGCYGHEAAETPVLDALASEGTLFSQALTVVPVTLPAHASLFTGLYPPATGVRYNGAFVLAEEHVTVAELLRDAGWATAGFSAAVPLAESTGVAQGFSTYVDIDDADQARKRQLTRLAAGEASENTRRAGEITDLGLEWLRGHAAASEGPFFMWLHYFDPHAPYDPPFPYSARFREHPYDGEIAYMDREIGRLFEGLRELALWDGVHVVVVGDHGEGLYEHREATHGFLVFDSTLRVPLIVRSASRSTPAVINEPVSVVDVAPTLLALAGLEAPAAMEGVSLLPTVESARPPDRRSLYFETVGGSINYGWSTLEGLRRGPLKYVRSVRGELYDLATDPAEIRNLYSVDPARAHELESELEARVRVWGAATHSAGAGEVVLDAEAMARLEALGYLGGDAAFAATPQGPHPGDLIHLAGRVRQARGLRESSPAEALDMLLGVLEEDPSNHAALFDAARAYLDAGDLGGARRLTDELERRHPDRVEAIGGLRERIAAASR